NGGTRAGPPVQIGPARDERVCRRSRSVQHATNASISAAVVVQPRLTRIAHSASSGGTPMASSTADLRTRPEEQAEPALTAIPARSKAMICVSLAAPGMDRQLVLGRRGASAP